MKKTTVSTIPFTVLLSASLLAGSAFSAEKEKEKPKMRDVVTHHDLASRKQNTEVADPFGGFEKAEGEDPAKKSMPRDIISQSDFLSSTGTATLVPKRAIIHVPPHLKSRTKITDGMKIVTWPEFIAMNRSWITTYEVSRLQAEGNAPLDEKKWETLTKVGDVIVATMGGSPISVLPLKEPETGEEGTVADQGGKRAGAVETIK